MLSTLDKGQRNYKESYGGRAVGWVSKHNVHIIAGVTYRGLD